LDNVLKQLEFYRNDKVIVNSTSADDAGVYLLDSGNALVQTTDFFTPIVDDPYLYGQIAAANSVSDIYAMGAHPLTALNILCFPEGQLDEQALQDILAGGIDKMKEADVVIIGGHSVSDKELKYGLAVTGIINPDKLKLNHTIQPGDQLLLTKPIGTGVLTTAIKNNVLTEDDIPDVISNMLLLNRVASEHLNLYPVNACTDITGYGLLGHIWEMIAGLSLSAYIFVDSVPFYEKAIPFAREGMHIPGGTIANYNFVEDHLDLGDTDIWYTNLLLDPQTSGGLLISIPEDEASNFIKNMEDNYPLKVTRVGEIKPGDNKIIVRS
jgi:selenide,water dikinase